MNKTKIHYKPAKQNVFSAEAIKRYQKLRKRLVLRTKLTAEVNNGT